MTETTKVRQCKQAPECKLAVDGKCIEGLEVKLCPHTFLMDQLSNVAYAQEASSKDNTVKLISGDEIKLADAHLLSANIPTRRIFIIGESDSGKTTLLVRLYMSFQHGSFGEYLFAGSYSLIGFELRCHLSKVESETAQAQTEKTNSREFNFLHLAVKRRTELRKRAHHLLVSDISGERIKLARDSSIEMKALGMPLRQSFRILINIDGAKIANRRTRMAAIIDAQTFLRQAIDDGVISQNSKIAILLSKWDLVNELTDFSFESDLVGEFRNAFGAHLKNLSFFRVAARPKNSNQVEAGFGIPELLADWITDDHLSVDRQFFDLPVESDRMISKYKVDLKNEVE